MTSLNSKWSRYRGKIENGEIAGDINVRWAARANDAGIPQRRKKQEEDRKIAQQNAALTEKKKQSSPPPKQPGKSLAKQATDVAGAVGNFVKDAALDVKDTAVNAVKYGAVERAANDADMTKLAAADRIKYLEAEAKKGTITKERLEKERVRLNQKVVDTDRKKQAVEKQMGVKRDTGKTAANVGETLLNVATLGVASVPKQLVKQSIKEGVKATTKAVLKEAPKVIPRDAAIGASYGVTQSVKNDDQANMLRNMAIGAGVGTAVPIAGGGANIVRSSKPIKAVDEFTSSIVKKSVAKAAQTKAGQHLGNMTEKAQVAMGEYLAPVMRDFKGKVEKDGRSVNENIRLLDTNVVNSAAITEGRIKQNKAWQELGELLQPDQSYPGSRHVARKEKDEIGQFINAKQEAINHNKLNPKKQVEVPIGTEKQEKAYQLLNQATKDDIQYAFDNDLITEANYTKYMNDPDYTRVQRDMSDMLDRNFKGVGGPNGSLSKASTFKQRLTGSKRASVDPFAAHFDWSDKVTREVQRQKLSNYIIEKRQEHGLGKGMLRKADDVEARQGAYAEAKQLRVLRQGLARAVKSEASYGKRLSQELSTLNQKGMKASIKNAGSSNQVTAPTRTITIKNIPEQIKPNAPKTLDGLQASYGVKDKLSKVYGTGETAMHKIALDIHHGGWDKVAKLTGVSRATGKSIAEQVHKAPTIKGAKTIITEGQIGKTPSAKAYIDQLVKTSTPELRAIRKKIAKREPKLAAHIDNLIGLKEQHEVAAKMVKDLTDFARSKADGDTKGKMTIKTLKRGIKEVYEDEPRIVNAINKVGKVEMHGVIRALQFPSRIIQRTSTALNAVFTVKNLARDQFSSFVNSKNALATHNPVSFMIGLKEAALKPSARSLVRLVGARKAADNIKFLQPTKEYEEFLKYVGGSTRTDIARRLKDTVRRTNESLGLKSETFTRKLENINSATENLTRFQNYIGTMRKGIKDGLDPETIEKNAIQAARENSVDFHRSGDWAPFMKIFNPFINANIQGGRSLVRAFQDRPVSTSMKVSVGLVAPVAAATYYNLADPERALIYSQLPETTRETNLIFITDEGNVFKFPLAPGVREFAAPVRGMIEAEYGEGDHPTFLQTAQSLFIDSVNPFNASDIVPTFAKPVVEDWANKNFYTGKEIVPDYLKDKAPEEQVYDSTSQIYRDVGAALNISPLRVQNMVRGYTSAVGTQSVSATDQARKATGEDVATDGGDALSLIKRGFYEDKPDQAKEAQSSFFDTYNPIKAKKDKVSAEVTDLIKAGNNAEALRRVKTFNEELRGRFTTFNDKYGDHIDPMWDEMMKKLYISDTTAAFKAREKSKF